MDHRRAVCGHSWRAKLKKETATMSTSQHLDIQEEGDVTIIRFRDSRITDPLEIEELGRQLYQALEQKNSSKLVVDLSPVEFLSSATIGKLISLNRKAKICNARLRLCNLQQGVRDIFHLCSLDRVFDVREDEAAALASL
jgi:anti-sigma B factor antagonist